MGVRSQIPKELHVHDHVSRAFRRAAAFWNVYLEPTAKGVDVIAKGGFIPGAYRPGNKSRAYCIDSESCG